MFIVVNMMNISHARTRHKRLFAFLTDVTVSLFDFCFKTTIELIRPRAGALTMNISGVVFPFPSFASFFPFFFGPVLSHFLACFRLMRLSLAPLNRAASHLLFHVQIVGFSADIRSLSCSVLFVASFASLSAARYWNAAINAIPVCSTIGDAFEQAFFTAHSIAVFRQFYIAVCAKPFRDGDVFCVTLPAPFPLCIDFLPTINAVFFVLGGLKTVPTKFGAVFDFLAARRALFCIHADSLNRDDCYIYSYYTTV